MVGSKQAITCFSRRYHNTNSLHKLSKCDTILGFFEKYPVFPPKGRKYRVFCANSGIAEAHGLGSRLVGKRERVEDRLGQLVERLPPLGLAQCAKHGAVVAERADQIGPQLLHLGQDGLIRCMFALLGKDIYKVTPYQVRQNLCDVDVTFLDTDYTPDYDVVLASDGTLQYTSLITDMIEDSERNQMIAENVKAVPGKSLVLTDRVSHVAVIKQLLGEKAIMLTGRIGRKEREMALGAILSGQADYLVATYAIAREGLDIPCLNNLFLATPKKDFASVVQAAGRVARKSDGKVCGHVYDYVDNFGMLRGWAKKRAGFYKKSGYRIAL